MAKFNIQEASKAMSGELLQGIDGAIIRNVTTDSRSVPAKSLFFSIAGDNFDGHDYVKEAFDKGARAVVVDRDISCTAPRGRSVIRVANTITALQDLATYHRKKFKSLQLIGVTGSNGKTTVKEMIATVLARKYRTLKTEGNLNNHIGTPLTLLRLRKSHEAAVIEMGMNSPGEIKRLSDISRPSIGVITNVAAAHLLGLGSVAAIRKAKGELLESMGAKGVAILNADDKNCAALIEKREGRTITFGRDASATVQLVDTWLNSGGSRSMVVHHKGHELELSQPLPGYHNVTNALAATAVGLAAGVDGNGIRAGLARVKAAPMRMQISKLANGSTLINDAYNANTASVEAALTTASELVGDGALYFAFGGILELGSKSDAEHKKVARLAKKSGVSRLFAYGKLAAVSALEAKQINLKCDTRQSHEALAKIVMKYMGPADTLLIKGSRGTRMELVEKYLIDMIGGRG